MVEETVLQFMKYGRFMKMALVVKVQPQYLAIAHRLKAGVNDKVRPVNEKRKRDVFCLFVFLFFLMYRNSTEKCETMSIGLRRN